MYIPYETFLQILGNFLSFKVLEEYVRHFNFASRLRIFHSKKDVANEGERLLNLHHGSAGRDLYRSIPDTRARFTQKVRSLW